MKARFVALGVLVGLALGSGFVRARDTQQTSARQTHIEWVGSVLNDMQTIKPGMTRSQLLKVFTEEGGLYTRQQQTFVSRECPYFKVNVMFEAAGRSQNSNRGENEDRVATISRPYLAFSVVN